MKTVKMMVMVVLVCTLVGCGEEQAQVARDTRAKVRVCKLSEGIAFQDADRVQGSVRTKVSVAIASRMAGTVDAVLADEGDTVKAGQPLFQVDKVNLENRVLIAQDDLTMAQALLEEAKAAQLEAQAANDKARIDLDRYSALYEKAAVTKDTAEKASLQMASSDAALQRAKAAVATAEARITQAKTALLIAQKNLRDSQGCAPFDGVLTSKLHDPGDFVSAGTPIFTMDDPKIYEVCFSLNAVRYADTKVGETKVQIVGGPLLTVTYKAPTVHPVARTFEVRATIERTADIAPGMIRDADIIFSAKQGAALPTAAVGLRGGKFVAFVVKAGEVAEIPVERGMTTPDFVEVRNAQDFAGLEIVKEGMLLLNVGDQVIPVSETSPTASK